jgi:hypothetical protein
LDRLEHEVVHQIDACVAAAIVDDGLEPDQFLANSDSR